MAKLVQDIYDELEAEKTNYTQLDVYNSTSNTALYIAFMWVVAYAHKYLYDAIDYLKIELANITSQQIIGTKEWYRGLALGWTGGAEDITACWVQEGDDNKTVIMKFANTNASTNSYTNLTDADYTGLVNYINSKKILGTKMLYISQAADLLALIINIKYVGNATIISNLVKAHIKQYLIDHAEDEQLSISLLQNSLFTVAGVVDASIEEVQQDNGTGYNVMSANNLTADAGYFEIGKDVSNNDLLTLNMYQ